MHKEENETNLGLFFELAENKIIYNQVPVNTDRRYGKIEKWLFYEWLFYTR